MSISSPCTQHPDLEPDDYFCEFHVTDKKQ